LLDKLNANWGARRVLLVGGADRPTQFMEALLTELGAKPARIPAASGSETLCRAMTAGRISAVIVPALHALAPDRDAAGQLAALTTLLTEAREAGVPLTILCSEENVYRAQQRPWYAREEDMTGGETRAGLIQSVLQLYADGVSRGMCGDAVRTLCVRVPPTLGSGSPATAQYTQWCRALLSDEVVRVRNPAMQGVFVHPLDAACGTLALGARFFAGDEPSAGIWNLGPGPQNLCANRSAALRLIARSGGTRPIEESEPPMGPALPLLDGAKARLLCGIKCQLTGDEALDMLLALERAAREGAEQELQAMRAQAQTYVGKLTEA